MADRLLMTAGFSVMAMCLLGISYQCVQITRILEHIVTLIARTH